MIAIESEDFRQVRGMSEVDIARAVLIIRQHRAELLAAWIEWHSMEEPDE